MSAPVIELPTPPRARYSRPQGRPLPPALAAVATIFRRAPRPALQVLRRFVEPAIVHRTPALELEYEDGRRFGVQAADRMYNRALLLGEYEPDTSGAMRLLTRPGDLVVDIGANHGWFSVLAAALVRPSGRVIAAEPVPVMARALEENLRRNPWAAVTPVRSAIGPEERTVTLHLFEGLPQGHASMSTFGRDDARPYTSPMTTLDVLLLDQPSPALIKVDVEGGELGVLQGARELLRRPNPPSWLIEVNHETATAFGYRPVDLLDVLTQAGNHRIFRARHGQLVPETAPREAPTDTTWVCVPPARDDRLGGA